MNTNIKNQEETVEIFVEVSHSYGDNETGRWMFNPVYDMGAVFEDLTLEEAKKLHEHLGRAICFVESIMAIEEAGEKIEKALNEKENGKK